MENLCCNKMSSFTNSSNSKLDSKLDSTKFETPSCITHRPLPIYQISFKLKKLFVDGRTYGRTGGRTFFPSILLGRLSEVDLKTVISLFFVAISRIR